MKAITVNQAKDIDLKAQEALGVSTLVLMENAAIAAAEFIYCLLKGKSLKRVAIFCGKGNNAGDGLVLSRQLICRGIKVDTFLLTPSSRLSLAARKNLKILNKITSRIKRIRNASDLKEIKFRNYGLVVDAIFGIGLSGQVTGLFKIAIEAINASGRVIVAVDTPSGLDADKGRVLGAAVKANYTVTFVAPKSGMLINQGPKVCGKIVVKHIGFPVAQQVDVTQIRKEGREVGMVSFEEFKKLDIKIARILEVSDHPDADKLVVLKIDVGDKQKQIVAGIKKFYEKEDLVGKQIVIIDNLEPVVLRGQVSEGMLLAARDEDNLSIVIPDKPIKQGSGVS